MVNHDLNRAGYFLGGNGDNPMKIVAVATRGKPEPLSPEFGGAFRPKGRSVSAPASRHTYG